MADANEPAIKVTLPGANDPVLKGSLPGANNATPVVRVPAGDDDERVRERRGGVERDADGGAADEVDVENDDKGGEIRCSEF